jgi:DNA polymerase-3 subunit alpha
MRREAEDLNIVRQNIYITYIHTCIHTYIHTYIHAQRGRKCIYCEAEYRLGLGDVYIDKKNPEGVPQGKGNRQRKLTDEEKIRFDKLKNVCSKKVKDFDEKKKNRLIEELRFLLKNPTIVCDIYEIGKYKKENGIGDINLPNSFILEILEITSGKTDFSKEFHFKFITDVSQSRISPPDIDIDFEKREVILNHLCDLYGRDKVALIGTANTYKPKAAIQNSAKALDITNSNKIWERRFSSENDQKAKEISKIMPNLPGVSLSQFVGEDPDYKPPNNNIKECIEKMMEIKKQYPELIEVSKKLEGKIRSFGTHAAGVVISSRPIVEDVPLHFAKVQKDFDDIGVEDESSVDLLTTQYDMKEVEELGLLKFDFLQLNNLRQIKDTLRLIEEKYGNVSFDINNLETNDKEVFDTINSMKLEGLFQISGSAFAGKDWPRRDKETGEVLRNKKGDVVYYHSPGVMEIIGCSSFDDIVVSNALGRPGPLVLGMPKKYAMGKNNPDSVEYPHERLRTILEETYGELCYQEQLIAMAQKLAGFNFSEADKLRKVCGKKEKKMLKAIEPKFREGCIKNNIPEKTIDEMWNIAVEFGSYAFNKAHSVGYAYITYQTGFLKTYYPSEFICSLLTSAALSSDERLEYLIDKIKYEYPKIEILKPEINKSRYTFYPLNKNKKEMKIISPLFSLKGVGKKVSDIIIEEREKIGVFPKMYSFLHTMSGLGKSVVSSSVGNILIDAGVFDEFGTRNEVREEMMRFNSIKKTATRGKKKFTDESVLGNMTSLF